VINKLTQAEWVNKIGSSCKVDDHSFVYVITGIMYRIQDVVIHPQVEISYLNDIEPKSTWIEGWRINFD